MTAQRIAAITFGSALLCAAPTVVHAQQGGAPVAAASPAPEPASATASASTPAIPAPAGAAAPAAAPSPSVAQADAAPTADVSKSASSTAPAPAPTAAPAPPSGMTVAGITMNGSLDAYMTVNPARGGAHQAPNDLRAFDTQANGISFSFAKIALERKPAPVGFRLDLGFGNTMDLVNSTDAAAGMGHDIMRNVEQAYVSWQATPRLALKVGKMVTHHGFEVIETQSNWNYTQSLLFTWCIPFTETGISADFAQSDSLELVFFLVNGLNNTFEGNDFKSPGMQAIVKPSSSLTLVGNFQAFNEQPGDMGGLTKFDQAVYLFDFVATYTASPKVELGFNGDFSVDTSIKTGKTNEGAAGYVRYHVSDSSAISGRAEYLHDGLSPTLGIPGMTEGDVVEGTATYSYAPAAGLLLRAEARGDQALGDYKPFTAKDGTAGGASGQVTLTLGAVAAF